MVHSLFSGKINHHSYRHLNWHCTFSYCSCISFNYSVICLVFVGHIPQTLLISFAYTRIPNVFNGDYIRSCFGDASSIHGIY